MPDDTTNEEELLEKFSHAVREGWAQRHPLTEQQRGLVRGAVEKQLREDKDLSPEERRKKAEKERLKQMEEQEQEHEMKKKRERGRGR